MKTVQKPIVITCISIILVFAATIYIATNISNRDRTLADTDIHIKVEGIIETELTTDDFLRMELVEQKITRLKENGIKETLTLTGVPFFKLLNYIGVDHFTSVDLISANGTDGQVKTFGLFAVYSNGRLLPRNKGPVWYTGSNNSTENEWVPKVSTLIINDKGNGLTFITPGPNELASASGLAGFEVSTISNLPDGYQRSGPIAIESHGSYNIAIQNWTNTEKGLGITLTQHVLNTPNTSFDGELIKTDSIEGYRSVQENHFGQQVLVFNWSNGLKSYSLSAILSDENDEEWIYELAANVN
jgi:hypothetical protein